MIFLDPIAGLIAAAVTAPALLILYFLKLRRRPVRISSTMLWESAVRDLQANAPFRWLRPSLLLLLQLLALACLLLAFARPAIDASDMPTGRLIIVIDRSASMSAPAEAEAVAGAPARSAASAPARSRETRLDAAKRQALELIRRLARSAPAGASRSEAMVIAFAADARSLTTFTSDRAILERAISSLAPTDQPADFESALRLVEAQTLRPGEADQRVRPRVVLISDGDLPRPEEGPRAGVGSAEFRFVRVGPPPEASRDNVGVVALSARRDYDDPSLVRLFVRLQNTLPRAVDAPIALRLDGGPVGARTLTIPGAGAAGPGELPATFELRTGGGGLVVASIARPDDLACDNSAALVLAPARSPRILLVRPPTSDEADMIAGASLERALEEVARGRVPSVDAGGYERLASAGRSLDGYDLVVFDRVRPVTLPTIPSISFGAAPPVPGLTMREPPPDADTGPARAERFLSWRRTSPFMRDVSLDTVVLARPLLLSLPGEPSDDTGASPAPGRRVSSRVLATGAAGPLIAEIDDAGVRRVVVAFALAQSTWTLQPSFIVFLANTVEQLTMLGEASAGRAFTTASPITVRAAPGATSLSVTGPLAFRVAAPEGAADAVPIGPLPLVGVYTVGGAAEQDRTLAVNLLDPRESAIATRQAVEVGGRATQATPLTDAAPREIWHWFVAGALLLLSIEWLLFAWRTRV